MRFVFVILFFVVYITPVSSQCLKSIDFSTWQQQGDLTQGSWTISNNNRTITQNENLKTTFYVSQTNFMNTSITGTIQVNDSDDDDYVGFVFGYRDPLSITNDHEYWLFAWKKGTQQDYVNGQFVIINGGFSLVRVKGSFTAAEINTAIWTHKQDSRFTIIEKKWGNEYGWESFKQHIFKLNLTPSNVQIYIDGNIVFDVDNCFQSGRFGFFNYSQQSVVYSNFNYTITSNFIADNVCENETFTPFIDNPSCQGTSNFSSYSWDFGDGNSSSQKLPTNTYAEAGNYTVVLTVKDSEGCTAVVKKDITVNGIQSDLAQYTGMTLCAKDSIILNTGGGFDSYTWQDGSTDSSYIAYTTGTYSVQIGNDCGTAIESVDIAMDEITSVTLGNDTTICDNATIKLQGKIENGTPFWYGGSGTYISGQREALLEYIPASSEISSGSLQLYFSAENGCNDTVDTITITFSNSPTVNAGYDITACANNRTITVGGTVENSSSFYWQSATTGIFGNNTDTIQYYLTDADTAQSVIYISLVAPAQNGCVEEKDSAKVVILSSPILKVTEHYQICSSNPEVTVKASYSGASKVNWSGAGTITSDGDSARYMPTDEEIQNKIFYVIAETEQSASCISLKDSTLVEVVDDISISFTATPASQTFPSRMVYVENNTDGDYTPTWNFGDGTTFQGNDTASNVYASSGIYTISLALEKNGCTYTDETQIEVIPVDLVAAFQTIEGGCAPLTVSPVQTSKNALEYYWKFEDVVIKEEAPTYTFENGGTYSISLIVENTGVFDTATQIVEIHPQPEIDFEVYPDIIDLTDGTANFANSTTGAQQYLWDFGDGETSGDSLVVHVYSDAGTYDVSLYAVSSNGCADTVIKKAAVLVKEECVLRFPSAINVRDLPKSNTVVAGELLEIDNLFVPLSKNIADFEMKIFDRWGELLFETDNPAEGWDAHVTSKPAPTGVYLYTCEAMCTNGDAISTSGSFTVLKQIK